MAPHPDSTWQPQPRRRAFASEPVSVCAARAFASDTLAAWDVAERCDDIQLCVSELVTNALVHGGDDARQFVVVLSVTDCVLRVEVRDAGAGVPRVRPTDAGSESGRGLLLVSECAETWGVDRSQSGQSKVVWAEFKVRSGQSSGVAS
ncbi:ATP-binding protein [Streptomyces sp. NPDC050315]|uniref:ATP-binding protein n=1 Tax=Streptomyces sp. NPDC050315 TaxID=3155039 RepID=UPI003427B519